MFLNTHFVMKKDSWFFDCYNFMRIYNSQFTHPAETTLHSMEQCFCLSLKSKSNLLLAPCCASPTLWKNIYYLAAKCLIAGGQRY